MQGFPHDHVFRGTMKVKQVGNSVPPCVARVLFGGIRDFLEGMDRKEKGEREAVGQTVVERDDREVIILD